MALAERLADCARTGFTSNVEGATHWRFGGAMQAILFQYRTKPPVVKFLNFQRNLVARPQVQAHAGLRTVCRCSECLAKNVQCRNAGRFSKRNEESQMRRLPGWISTK